ncbi:MAG: EscU/YscU/HrcU family type III secretion system export apparatus switch protein [Acidobacteriota bacterium]|nr:EscU/YscU/HrcU family type III secretion system export apparatus switch protein [Acidobacteriota bacterium]
MAGDNKTEQATEHRRKKAREEGQVARSRELSSSAAVMAALLVLSMQLPAMFASWRHFYMSVLDHAVDSEITLTSPLISWAGQAVLDWTWRPLAAAGGVALLASLAQGGFVFVPKLLAPNIQRMNPANRLGQIFSLITVVQLLKALIPGVGIVYFTVTVFRREWSTLALGTWASPRQLAAHLGTLVFEICWKCGLLLLIWAVVDYAAMRRKQETDLRMSKEEIREEMKQLDGNPHTKGRIRRLQRMARRARMVQATKNATVVVTNPTHYAVALEYRDNMPAPSVVAKGQNLIAQQIKEIALWEGIPVVENRPLAQSLYRTVEVGQVIPEKLYAAVAEILAYVFRVNAQAAAGRG